MLDANTLKQITDNTCQIIILSAVFLGSVRLIDNIIFLKGITMFNITNKAKVYMADLFAQQDEKDLGLKVDIEKAGTPAATVIFNFAFLKN